MTSTGNFFFDFAARKRNIFSRPAIYYSCYQVYGLDVPKLWMIMQ